MYGRASEVEPLEWAWVDDQLRRAMTYWVIARTDGHPHPRPVWGVWRDERLQLSIGTPTTLEALRDDPTVTVHLDSGTDVVVVEGASLGSSSDAAVVKAYDDKYDWSYDAATYGPLTTVAPVRVLAWRAAGRAGREGFRQAGRFTFG